MKEEKVGINPINPKILELCRKQMTLSIDDAQRKGRINTLVAMEKGKRQPTLSQIERLSQLYLVPPWVFMRKSLPKEYNFGTKVASFRNFKDRHGNAFGYQSRRLITMIEQLRKTIIELKEEMEESLPVFSPPKMALRNNNIREVSKKVRDWLDSREGNFDFAVWRKKLEDKGVFVFVTSPLNNWSKTDSEEFRGISIYHKTLPIIIINGSDSYKAKSFTLFHELGHLLMKKTTFDKSVGESSEREEEMCDQLSGEILMPKDKIKQKPLSNLQEVDIVAKKFKTSRYATLVRLKKLSLVNKANYRDMVKSIIKNRQSSNKNNRIPRSMAREVRSQYGKIYLETVLEAYYNKCITLHKARNMFGLKKTEHILKIMGRTA